MRLAGIATRTTGRGVYVNEVFAIREEAGPAMAHEPSDIGGKGCLRNRHRRSTSGRHAKNRASARGRENDYSGTPPAPPATVLRITDYLYWSAVCAYAPQLAIGQTTDVPSVTRPARGVTTNGPSNLVRIG